MSAGRWTVSLLLCACSPREDTPHSSVETGGAHETCPSGRSGPTIDEGASATCDEGGTIRFGVRTTGLVASALVWVIETGDPEPWDEEHDLLDVAFDIMCGEWDVLGISLSEGEAGDYQRNSVAAFPCPTIEPSNGQMTYAFAVTALDGTWADCKVGGADPEGVIRGDYGPDYRGTGPSFDLSACGVAEVTDVPVEWP